MRPCVVAGDDESGAWHAHDIVMLFSDHEREAALTSWFITAKVPMARMACGGAREFPRPPMHTATLVNLTCGLNVQLAPTL